MQVLTLGASTYYHYWTGYTVFGEGTLVGSSIAYDTDLNTLIPLNYHGLFVDSYISYTTSGNACRVYVGWTNSYGEAGTTSEWLQTADRLGTPADHADYHSVDTGDVLTGRPYGYTEEYQSYEQTGTTNPAYWGCGYTMQHNLASPSDHRTAVTADGTWLNRSTYPLCTPEVAFYPAGSIDPIEQHLFCSCWYFGNGTGYTGACKRGIPHNAPIMGYVTRTRIVTYDKQSGLFSIGIGVPYAALNSGLYSTRRGTVPVDHV